MKCRQTENAVRWKITPEERDQIWAEAKYYYEQGESCISKVTFLRKLKKPREALWKQTSAKASWNSTSVKAPAGKLV